MSRGARTMAGNRLYIRMRTIREMYFSAFRPAFGPLAGSVKTERRLADALARIMSNEKENKP